MEAMEIIVIHNLVNPETGKTYKEENLEKQHKYRVNDLVEDIEDGIRLYVIGCVRDCDGTPLYVLGEKGADLYSDESKAFYNYRSHPGYPEDSLKLIRR